MYFQKLVFFIIIACAVFIELKAQADFQKFQDITVGEKPMGIFFDAKKQVYNVFCNGIDNNFNGKFEPDSGDISASWWIIRKQGDKFESEKVYDFNGKYLDFYNFRPGIRLGSDDSDGIIYIAHIDKTNSNFEVVEEGNVAAYSLDSYSLLDSCVYGHSASALNYDDGKLYISLRSPKNQVIVYNPDEKQVDTTLQAETMTAQSLVFDYSGAKGIAILNEGYFGQNNSTLQLGAAGLDSLRSFPIGNGGNHLAKRGKLLAVTVNGSHCVKMFDLEKLELINSIDTKTDGWDGPRMTEFYDDNKIIVPAYSGAIREFDVKSGDLLFEFHVDGKPETVTLSDDKMFLFVTIQLKPSYAADNRVSILKTSLASVDGNDNRNRQASISPNPVNSAAVVDFGRIMNNPLVQIYDYSGNIFYSKNIIGNSSSFIFSTEQLNCSNSFLYIRISDNQTNLVLPFALVR